MNNLVVVFGGESVEHDISIITGLKFVRSLNRSYNIFPIYYSLEGEFFYLKNLNWSDFTNINKLKSGIPVCFVDGAIYAKKHKKLKFLFSVDYLFNCCHGGVGENGELLGYFKTNNIKTSCNLKNISSNKYATKQFAKGIGVEVLNSVLITSSNVEEMLNYIKENMSQKLIVKPNNLGSSVGVIVTDFKHLKEHIELLLHLDNQLIVEEYLKDVEELHCAVLNNKNCLCVSAIEKVVLNNEIWTFEDKYMNKNSNIELPAKIDDEIKNCVYDYSKKLFDCLNLSGVVEIQFFYDKLNNKLYFNEVNTVCKKSSYNLFEPVGMSFKMIVSHLIEEQKHFKKQTYFNSDLLSKIDLNF